MLKAQALKGSTQHVLTPGITRQMAVAWVTVSCHPLSVVEDEGFLAFLADDQVCMMPSHQEPTKKKTQGEEETADAGDTDKQNCEEEGDWEVEADEETESDDDDSKDGSNDPQGAIEDEDDLDVSRALNPDLDVDPGDEDQLRDVAKSAAENAKPSTSSRATRELLLRNKEIAAAMKKMAWLATLLRYSPYKRRMFQRHCARMGSPVSRINELVDRMEKDIKLAAKARSAKKKEKPRESSEDDFADADEEDQDK
ncbi:unnamed protein product [Tilletia caries]|uniref:Uncharacterized protein n=1 Tax=Tilletia caries TaxID=13290 RepID=A0ABN7IRF9_9BASI|nr:unnamed protein product [Tilletia caries]CAD6918048.1 unnamed protein product [Tilletia caries]